MTEAISDALLQRLSEFVARHFGLHFPRERWSDLLRAACAAARETNCPHVLDQYVEKLLSSTGRQTEIFARHLTVGETYFFRERRSLEVLENDIVPELIRRHTDRAIRIWSAGCATGEEPYSVAMALSRLIAGLEHCNIEILATDLNAKSLQKALAGTYGEWSFRNTPAWVRNTYFEAIGENRWAISPAIKKMVSFAEFNLMDDSLPPHSNSGKGFDVIFCRNVLMYFTPEGMSKAVRHLYRSLASEGWLIVSPTETSQELFPEFAAIDFGGITLYRKPLPIPRATFSLPSAAYGGNEIPPLLEQRFENLELAPSPSSNTHPQWNDITHLEEASTPGQPPALDERRHGDVRQAIGTLALQEGKDDDPQAMLAVARAFGNQGNLAAALAWCDKAIAADKMAARAYYLKAIILQEQGFLSDAVFAFKQTVYVEPQFVLGHFCLGNLALSQGKLRESEKHFENVLLLLARYQPEEIVPESEGISAGRLGEMIASRRGEMASINPEAEVAQSTFPRTGKSYMELARSR